MDTPKQSLKVAELWLQKWTSKEAQQVFKSDPANFLKHWHQRSHFSVLFLHSQQFLQNKR